MPKVSLIIPTYNREEILCNTIKYALNQQCQNYEILVIDQTVKHTNETYRYLNKISPHVRVIKHYPPSSPGARNRGIREAKGEIVILIDDDVIIEKDFIAQHLKYYGNPKVVGVTGRVDQESRFITRIPSFLKSDFIQWISTQKFMDMSEREAYRAAGGNFSFRKKTAMQVGLYDENFIGTYWGEEYDFSLRLRGSGHKIIYNPKAIIYHLNEPKGGVGDRKRFDINTIYSKSHNLSYMIEKNRLNRAFYLYLIWYIYKQDLIKKDYLSLKGFLFLPRGHLYFIKGLLAGFKKGKKRVIRARNA